MARDNHVKTRVDSMKEIYVATLAHAVSNEYGKSTGGKPGDQKQNSDNTKGELLFQDWYVSGSKWDCVLRGKTETLRSLIADDAIKAVRNKNIGYSQDNRYTLYDASKGYGFDCGMVDKPVECDCSSLMTVCANYAGIAIPRDTRTANMKLRYSNTKAFKILESNKYVLSSSYLKKGDILVRGGHHTACVVNTLYHMTRELRYDEGKPLMTGKDVKALQQRLNDLYVVDVPLVVDGELGRKTDAAIRAYQRQQFLETDGIMGEHTAISLGFLWR